ncbi:MAG TPA: hypothetical protein VGS10_18250 [Terracidiphilus sp.]|nr:hypothetical protein [Terracidiphilus sp.]
MISTALDEAFDKLPDRAKVVFVVLTIEGSVYGISQCDFLSFLLHAIFSQ